MRKGGLPLDAHNEGGSGYGGFWDAVGQGAVNEGESPMQGDGMEAAEQIHAGFSRGFTA